MKLSALIETKNKELVSPLHKSERFMLDRTVSEKTHYSSPERKLTKKGINSSSSENSNKTQEKSAYAKNQSSKDPCRDSDSED